MEFTRADARKPARQLARGGSESRVFKERFGKLAAGGSAGSLEAS